jgi:tetratricopeptide (TPR) repeat protein
VSPRAGLSSLHLLPTSSRWILGIAGAILIALGLPLAQMTWRVNGLGIRLNRQHMTKDFAELTAINRDLEALAASPTSRKDTSFWRTYGAAAGRQPTELAFRRLLAARDTGKLDRIGQLWLGEVAAATGHYDEANEAYVRMDATNLLINFGDAAAQRGARDEARSWYLLAASSVYQHAKGPDAQTAPERVTALVGSGGSLLQTPGGRAVSLLRIGRGLLSIGFAADAVAPLERAIDESEINPPGVRERQGIRLGLARALVETADPIPTERVQGLIDQALALDRTAPALVDAARIVDQIGQRGAAMRLLREAIHADPRQASGYLGLGNLLDQENLPALARDVYAEGTKALSSNVELATALAVSSYRTLPAQEALPLLEHALSMGSTDEYLFAAAADCFLDLGRPADTRAVLAKGLTLHPDSERLTTRWKLLPAQQRSAR